MGLAMDNDIGDAPQGVGEAGVKVDVTKAMVCETNTKAGKAKGGSGFRSRNSVLVPTQRILFLALHKATLRSFTKFVRQQAAQPGSTAIWVRHRDRHPDQDGRCPVYKSSTFSSAVKWVARRQCTSGWDTRVR